MICKSCTKRDRVGYATERIQDLHYMQSGGMPIQRDELPADVWLCLGHLAKLDAAMMGTARALHV